MIARSSSRLRVIAAWVVAWRRRVVAGAEAPAGRTRRIALDDLVTALTLPQAKPRDELRRLLRNDAVIARARIGELSVSERPECARQSEVPRAELLGTGQRARDVFPPPGWRLIVPHLGI